MSNGVFVMRNLSHPNQGDLFAHDVFPVRAPSKIELGRFRAKLKRAMSEAIRRSGKDRHAIALAMARELGIDGMSKAMLDSYTSEAKETHDISLVRFSAFVRAVDAPWLWDAILATDGFTVLEGEEARLAEIGRLEHERKRLQDELRKLRAVPVEPKSWRRR